MAKISVIIRKDRVCSKGKNMICLQLLHQNTKKLYSLKMSVAANFFDSKAEKVKSGEGSALRINHAIANAKEKALNALHALNMGNNFSIPAFEKLYKNASPKNAEVTFVEFFDQQFELQKANISQGTVKGYRQIRKKMFEFAPKQTIAMIDVEFLNNFQMWLRTVKNLNKNGANKMLTFLRLYLIRALKQRIIAENPFDHFSLNWEKTSRQYLDEAELANIIALVLGNDGEARARDMFVFQCCTGLRCGDLFELKWTDLHKDFIKIVQGKTKNEVVIPLTSQNALRVLEKQDRSQEFVFYRISSQQYNNHLKTIAKRAVINKNISSHIARHTFATLCLTCDIDIKTVSSMLGHTSVKVTEIYAKIIPNKKIEEMKKFRF